AFVITISYLLFWYSSFSLVIFRKGISESNFDRYGKELPSDKYTSQIFFSLMISSTLFIYFSNKSPEIIAGRKSSVYCLININRDFILLSEQEVKANGNDSISSSICNDSKDPSVSSLFP